VRDAERRRLGAIWSALWPGAAGLGIALGAAVLGISYEHVMMGTTSVKVAVYVGLAVVVADLATVPGSVSAAQRVGMLPFDSAA
jgi:hypothetical protein